MITFTGPPKQVSVLTASVLKHTTTVHWSDGSYSNLRMMRVVVYIQLWACDGYRCKTVIGSKNRPVIGQVVAGLGIVTAVMEGIL